MASTRTCWRLSSDPSRQPSSHHKCASYGTVRSRKSFELMQISAPQAKRQSNHIFGLVSPSTRYCSILTAFLHHGIPKYTIWSPRCIHLFAQRTFLTWPIENPLYLGRTTTLEGWWPVGSLWDNFFMWSWILEGSNSAFWAGPSFPGCFWSSAIFELVYLLLHNLMVGLDAAASEEWNEIRWPEAQRLDWPHSTYFHEVAAEIKFAQFHTKFELLAPLLKSLFWALSIDCTTSTSMDELKLSTCVVF